MAMDFSSMGNAGANLGRSVGRGVQALFMAPHVRNQAAMQAGLMGAQRSVADEQARGLRMTNDARAGVNQWIDGDPDMAALASVNPDFARALRIATRQFGLTGEANISGASGNLLGQTLTGLGAQAGARGDLAAQNRLIAAAAGKTHAPYSAIGNTGYVLNPETGGIGVGSGDMAGFFRQAHAAQQALRAAQTASAGKTTLQQNLEAAGFAPGSPEYQRAMLEGLRGTTVNVNASEKAWDTEMGKLAANQYKNINASAANSQEMLAMYDLFEQALDGGARTGFAGETELAFRKMGAALGIGDPDKLSGAELVQAIQNRQALIMRNPDAGMGMPGALSDRDIKFLKDSQIGVDRSPEGNRRMLAAFRALERRKIDLAQLADEYVAEQGRLDTGFNRVLREYAEANPMFQTEPAAPAQDASVDEEQLRREAILRRAQADPEFAKRAREMGYLP